MERSRLRKNFVSALKVQGLKRGHLLNDLASRVELVPSKNPLQVECVCRLAEFSQCFGITLSAQSRVTACRLQLFCNEKKITINRESARIEV
jgi:hypothetical protein